MTKKRNSLLYRSGQKLLQAKRFVFNRRGDGVHSPYAFNLISKVIRNPYPYDCFRLLKPEYKHLSNKLKKVYGDQAVHSIKTAELIFRLAIHHHSDQCLLLTNEESLLLPYLEATAKFSNLSIHNTHANLELKPKALIILENYTEQKWEVLEQLIKQSSKEYAESGLMLIINSQNPLLYKQKKDLVKRLSPRVHFQLKGLDIFVWRKALTKGKYSVYAKA